MRVVFIGSHPFNHIAKNLTFKQRQMNTCVSVEEGKLFEKQNIINTEEMTQGPENRVLACPFGKWGSSCCLM